MTLQGFEKRVNPLHAGAGCMPTTKCLKRKSLKIFLIIIRDPVACIVD